MFGNSRINVLELKIEGLQNKLDEVNKKLETIEKHLNVLALTMIIKLKGEGKIDPEDLLKRFDPEGKELKN